VRLQVKATPLLPQEEGGFSHIHTYSRAWRSGGRVPRRPRGGARPSVTGWHSWPTLPLRCTPIGIIAGYDTSTELAVDSSITQSLSQAGQVGHSGTRAKNFSVAFEVKMVRFGGHYTGRGQPLTGVQSLGMKPSNPFAKAKPGPRGAKRVQQQQFLTKVY